MRHTTVETAMTTVTATVTATTTTTITRTTRATTKSPRAASHRPTSMPLPAPSTPAALSRHLRRPVLRVLRLLPRPPAASPAPSLLPLSPRQSNPALPPVPWSHPRTLQPRPLSRRQRLPRQQPRPQHLSPLPSPLHPRPLARPPSLRVPRRRAPCHPVAWAVTTPPAQTPQEAPANWQAASLRSALQLLPSLTSLPT